MEELVMIAGVCSSLTTICAAAALFIKPLREKLLGHKRIIDGQRCLLRSDMLRIYYRHKNRKKIRQYEYENFLTTYDAYKALGGNSFIEHIYAEVIEWEIVP